jgi:hypothetical protein
MAYIVNTDKPLNLDQLSHELSAATGLPAQGFRAVEGKWVCWLTDTPDPIAFNQVVEAHVADPEWKRPAVVVPGFLRRLFRRKGSRS